MSLQEPIVRMQNERIEQLVNSPAYMVVGGTLPGIAVATTLQAGLAIGVATAIALVVSWAVCKPVTALVGNLARIPVSLAVCTTVGVLVGFAMRIIDPASYETMSMYIPLATFAPGVLMQIYDPARTTAARTLGTAVCTVVVLAVLGCLNAVLQGQEVWGVAIEPFATTPLAIAGTPAWSLMMIAVLAAVVQACTQSGGER